MSTAFDLTLEETAASSGEPMTTGTVRLGGLLERFEADLSYWTPDQYRASWRAAASILLEGGEKAAFVTSITDPATANFIFWWTAYRDGEKVHVQQQVLFMDRLQAPFDPSDLVRHVGPREVVDEDGNQISEWTVSIDDIRAFRDSQDAA
jgi:hypothetical protein